MWCRHLPAPGLKELMREPCNARARTIFRGSDGPTFFFLTRATVSRADGVAKFVSLLFFCSSSPPHRLNPPSLLHHLMPVQIASIRLHRKARRGRHRLLALDHTLCAAWKSFALVSELTCLATQSTLVENDAAWRFGGLRPSHPIVGHRT